MIWHEIIYSICVGALIMGVILTLLLMILSASNLSNSSSDSIEHSEMDSEVDSSVETDHGTHLDHDSDIDHDSFDHGSDIDHDSFDHGSDIDHDSFDHGSDIDHDSFDHGSDIDHDSFDHGSDIDHDSFDHGSDVDHDTHLENDDGFNSDSELGLDMDVGSAGSVSDMVNYSTNTPTSLVFSLYLLWFGTMGTFTYNLISLKIIWLIVVLLVPVGITKIVSKGYESLAKNRTYRVRVQNELLGREALVKIAVDQNGGVISLRTTESVQQIGAQSLFPLSYFYPGDTVYICAYENGMYYVDSNAQNVKLSYAKKGKKNENKSSISKISNFHQATISRQR
ncbi:hypothetical protein NEF87_001742 [Candidatus Lokiarchaeum ossiferum]|uniref:DUF1449 family protein n=1 Tax=Candidatus Lokiarchaeum ossiferum TaxID=2951803 RepID=A0ABY6HSV0_9ARCH|nr:hypothetical protein NEF87_001742 [Candidatus Lokiarchaeum sp. B-35]